ncbi:MAG: hypothetical protein COA78_30695 [Blastopirellula sp.]|nr:MAG: hypothetical protein COA78_30695 [Blastopirellula sp.]
MSESSKPASQPYAAGNQELAEYREPSRLAIGGMVLGLLSVLALFGPAFWIIPMSAVAISAFAWRSINSHDHLSGKTLAIAGLILGPLFGGIAFTSNYVQRQTLQSNAQALAEGWIKLMAEGKIYEGHQLTLMPGERQPLEADLDFFYQENESIQEPIENFESRPSTQWFRKHVDADVSIRFISFASTSFGEDSDRVLIEYELTANSNGNSDSKFFELYLNRTLFQSEDTARYLWEVRCDLTGA